MPTDAVAAEVIDEELAGLDHLEVQESRPLPWWRRAWNALWPKVAAVGLVVLIWQIAVWREWKKDYLLPPPAKVWDRLVDDLGTSKLWDAVGTTMQRAIIGFLLALVVGGLIGLAVTASRHVRSAVASLLTGLQTMPSIAWFPLAILLLGLTEDAIMFVVVLGAAPAIANGFIAGVDSSPPLLQSLGTRLEFAREFHDSRGVLASMIVIAIIGVLMDSLVFSRIERRVLRRRGLGVQAR